MNRKHPRFVLGIRCHQLLIVNRVIISLIFDYYEDNSLHILAVDSQRNRSQKTRHSKTFVVEDGTMFRKGSTSTSLWPELYIVSKFLLGYFLRIFTNISFYSF